MTLNEAVQQAVAHGYGIPSPDGIEIGYSGANAEYTAWTRADTLSSFMLRIEETLLDPIFWRCLYGPVHAESMALHMVKHLFEGGSVESFFRDHAVVKQPCGLPPWFPRLHDRVQIFSLATDIGTHP